jgi:hypothetical protein
MLKFLLSVLLMANPEVVCTLGPAGPSYNAYSDERSSGDALELAGKVNAALVSSCQPKCPRISMFRNPTAANLMLMRDSGQTKLVYKPAFFTSVYESYGDGGILALIAHEVGHAIDASAPAAWMKSNWTSELRADAWSGCALAKMNVTSRSLRAGLDALSKYPSTAQPNWSVRLPVIEAGYAQCGGDPKKMGS